MRYTILIALLLFLGGQAFGQKKPSKAEIQAQKLDSVTQVNRNYTARLDSISKVTAMLTGQLDSLNRTLSAHEVMYDAIRDKVIKHDFDPARAGFLVDSLKASREKESAGLTRGTQALRDSVSMLNEENAKLKADLVAWETRDANNEQVVRDLEQLKGLLDQKIITQAEFDQRKAKLLAKWK
jgi:hypothetical protein